MASVGVGLNAQLGAEFWGLELYFIVELALGREGTVLQFTCRFAQRRLHGALVTHS